VASDGKFATAISAFGVLILMLIFFKSPRTLVAVIVPLAVACSLTMGLTAFIYGRLTILTVFVLAMLIGMGIDYGIHIFGRIQYKLSTGASLRDATAAGIRDTGGALAIAALTTVASLLTLLIGHFKGFKEFGIVASYGLILSVVCTILIIPPAVAAMDRIVATKYSRQNFWNNRPVLRGIDTLALVRGAFAVGLVFTICFFCLAQRLNFEYDFRNLRSERTGTTISYGRAVGKSAGTAPAVILGKNRAQIKAAHTYLLERKTSKQAPELGSFITLYTFVPDWNEQIRRHAIIEKIGDIAGKKAMRRLKGEKLRLLDELKSMAAAEPFTEKDIPDWANRIVTEQDGRVGLVGHMYTKIEDWNAKSVSDFKKRYGTLEFEGKPLPIAYSGFILSDIVDMVKADGLRLILFVSMALLFILFIFTRCIRATLVLFGVIASSAIWTIGVMGLFDVRIGLYNLIVIPVILGVGIDSAIHLYHRHRSLGSPRMGENLRTTGFAVTASSFTTMAGFVGLLFVAHKGLKTIGVLALMGVGLSWLAVMMLLPYLMIRFLSPRKTAHLEHIGEASLSGL
ncbi:MAG: MMPL family transporter, partial [Proteobacteria bacterium]|nr:MMPL family transporter [Pseudomonadota bacterium]